MVDAVFGVLMEKLLTFIQDEAHLVREFSGQFTKMKDELQFMQSYLTDVDQVKRKDQRATLKTISQKVRELLYDAEDVIADCELMFVKEQRQRASNCTMCCSPSFLIFRYQTGKKLSTINQKIESLKESMKSYLATVLILPSQNRIIEGVRPMRYPILINQDEIVGLNDDLKKILEWVLHADEPLTVIGIVGMGGIGKTTLAQKIYNDDIVKRSFDRTLIVVVSQSFDLKEIMKDMLKKLDVREDLLMRDEIGLSYQLHEQLNGKYLLILDDIWNTDEGGSSWWESLSSALPKRNDGSCIIVTTRNEEVARSMGAIESRIHHSQLLSFEDSWSLFSKISFSRERGQCPNPELEHIGKEIVAQCGGLPLAVRVVAGMMLGKGLSFFEWKRVSDHFKEELVIHKKGDLVLSTLRLSYEELPMHLKPCMMCLALFPGDFEINRDYIIYWWIGEGFLGGRDEMTAYEIGEECLTELVSRGLLLVVNKDIFERVVVSFKVHDMVRNMIIKISEEENFMSLGKKGDPSLDIQSRRVGIMKTTTDGLFFREHEINSKLLHLRTIVWKNFKEREFISKLYQLKWLRVLTLEFTRNYGMNDPPGVKDDWWSGIGSLSHLNFLKIVGSRMERLPNSIGNLQKLQVILLVWCPNLKMLPTQITTLEKLTIFRVFICNSLKFYPKGIENLSNLEELGEFKPACSRDREGSRVSELQKLTKLRRLYMKIDSEDEIGDKELHMLSQLKQLKCLSLNFGYIINTRDEEHKNLLLKKVDYEISPCHLLQELYLFNFPGEETPAWLNPTTFPNLRFLNIFKGKIKHMHPRFFGNREEENGMVWKLEALVLNHLIHLEEEWPSMQRVMPSLRLLKVERCPKLKLFPCDVEDEGIWRKQEASKSLSS